MSIEKFFYEHPVFRHKEFTDWKLAQRAIQATSVNMALSYYLKTGQNAQIHRGLYAVVPPNQTKQTLSVDSYLIAAKSAVDAILSHHTALELHGIAYSSFGQFTYQTTQKNKPFEFQGQWFQAITHPTALQKKENTLLGTQTINRQGLDITITNLARTFVDILDRVELCGGWEEVCRAINNMSVLNLDEAIGYCLLHDNARLAAKVGYFLEQRRGAFAATDTQLKKLLRAKPPSPQYASKRSHEKFQVIKKWGLYLPLSVIKQSWEEPHVDI